MEKSEIWTVIGVALIVAIIASVATVSLTGNVVKVTNLDSKACTDSCNKDCGKLPRGNQASCRIDCTQSCVKAKVYTTAEIDAKLEDIYTENVVVSSLRTGQVSQEIILDYNSGKTYDIKLSDGKLYSVKPTTLDSDFAGININNMNLSPLLRIGESFKLNNETIVKLTNINYVPVVNGTKQATIVFFSANSNNRGFVCAESDGRLIRSNIPCNQL